MTNENIDKAKDIANQIQNDIANADCGCTYTEIVKLAIITAKQVRKELPMYTGGLNLKWAIYNFMVELLESRLNGV